MRSATTGFFSTFASTKSLMRHRSSQHLKNVAVSLYGPGPCDTVKAVGAPVIGLQQGRYQAGGQAADERSRCCSVKACAVAVRQAGEVQVVDQPGTPEPQAEAHTAPF